MIRRALAVAFALMMMFPPFIASGQDAGGELVLRVAMHDDIKGLNPIVATDAWSDMVLKWIYDYPVLVDYDSQEVMPYIAVGSANHSGKAESWDDCAMGNFGYCPKDTWLNASKQEAIIFYDFTNVTWHDGTQMTVRDIMFSFHLAGQIPEWSSSMNPLKDRGGEWHVSNYSRTGWLCIHKVWESGNRAALKFVLQEPYANFFKVTASPKLFPWHIWGNTVSGQLSGAKIWCDPDYLSNPWLVAPAWAYENDPPVGSGLFKFAYWELGQIIRLDTYREHFHSLDYAYKSYVEAAFPNRTIHQPAIDAMTFRIYRTAEAAVLAMENGEIDFISWSIPPTFIREFSRMNGVSLYAIPENGFFYMAYNMRRTSFGYQDGNASLGDAGKPLRRAMAHCIDKQKIIERLLLCHGVAGNGPVNPGSELYNTSLPTYDFNPAKAKQILADAGYMVFDGTSYLTGDAAIAAAGEGKWWVRPDGMPIGSEAGGGINILTPEANYDPIRAQAGLMIALQLRYTGINAYSVAMDFGSIVDRIIERNFDMYVLGWNVGSDPSDFIYAFCHSSNAEIGENYPGYQNRTFDQLVDMARRTGDDDLRRKYIMDAQAALVYDLPFDVLYFRSSILPARTDSFIGWIMQNGNVFNRDSIVNLRPKPLFALYARFMEPKLAVFSNSSTQLSISLIDGQGQPMGGASLSMDTTMGALSPETGASGADGTFTTTFKAPYVPPTQDNIDNGSQAFIQITSAAVPDLKYAPSPPRFILVTVYPEEAQFLNLRITADPDIIDDLGDDRTTPGFTNIVVEVTDQDNYPVPYALVNLTDSSGTLAITPSGATASQDGKATFTVTAANLSADDGSVGEFTLTAQARSSDSPDAMRTEGYMTLLVLDREAAGTAEVTGGLSAPMIALAAAAVLAVLAYVIARRKRK